MTVDSRSPGRVSRLDAFEKRLAVVPYIDELAGMRWIWGECDCTMAVGAWIERVTGSDPFVEFRGTYHTAEEARATAKRAGGFAPTVGRLLDEAAFERVSSPEDGDVGLIIVPMRERNILPVVGAILAIWVTPLWVCKSLRGLVGRGDFEPVHVWRI